MDYFYYFCQKNAFITFQTILQFQDWRFLLSYVFKILQGWVKGNFDLIPSVKRGHTWKKRDNSYVEKLQWGLQGRQWNIKTLLPVYKLLDKLLAFFLNITWLGK